MARRTYDYTSSQTSNLVTIPAPVSPGLGNTRSSLPLLTSSSKGVEPSSSRWTFIPGSRLRTRLIEAGKSMNARGSESSRCAMVRGRGHPGNRQARFECRCEHAGRFLQANFSCEHQSTQRVLRVYNGLPSSSSCGGMFVKPPTGQYSTDVLPG